MASTLAPRANMGVDPTRSRDIMDDMVNVVRIARATPSRAASRPVISNSEDSLVPPSLRRKSADPPSPSLASQVETYVADGFDSFEECVTPPESMPSPASTPSARARASRRRVVVVARRPPSERRKNSRGRPSARRPSLTAPPTPPHPPCRSARDPGS
eukprot:6928-Pelagococcus_subviridis.AAC.2